MRGDSGKRSTAIVSFSSATSADVIGKRLFYSSEYPITESLVKAFLAAILAFHDWQWGGPEPQISLDGKSFPISEIADFVSVSDDPMPDGLYKFLCRAIGTHNAPTDRTFAAGADSLYRSCVRQARQSTPQG
jgi:hypothetical protein